MTSEREELYRHIPPPGYPIPVGDFPLLVYDDIPEDEDIAWAVCRLILNLLCGPSRIRAEHLRQWLITAMRDNLLAATNWLKVVAIVQSVLCEGALAK